MAGNEIEPGGEAAEVSRHQLVLSGLIIDILIQVPETVAIILSGSAILVSDAIKSANEILAPFFALLIIRRVTAGGGSLPMITGWANSSH